MIGPQPSTARRRLTWGNGLGASARAAIGCAAAGLALTACTVTGSDPTPAITTPTPSLTASSPSPAPSASNPPERPAAMERDDVEGAIAAAQYFLELYPYVYNTGDLTEWQAMSHPDCVFCASVVENVEELHAAGGYETGGEFIFGTVEAHGPIPGNEFFGVDFALTQAAGRRYDSAGLTVDSGTETRFAVSSALRITPDGWSMRAVSFEEAP